MNKLHSLTFYALVTPAIMLSSTAVVAQQSTGQNADREQQTTQRDQDATRSTPGTAQGDQSTRRTGQSASQTAADHENMHDQARMQHRGYMDSAPASGMQVSELIGAEVSTTDGEDVGPVEDLIIDENGQIVAIVLGVGGFLGMGEKVVAIGWDDVTRSGTAEEYELQIDVTREGLRAAPEFESED